VFVGYPQSLVVSGCDSFNSLENMPETDFWAVATVLRFLYKKLQAAKHVPLSRQF
jgi:hypothetical protein